MPIMGPKSPPQVENNPGKISLSMAMRMKRLNTKSGPMTEHLLEEETDDMSEMSLADRVRAKYRKEPEEKEELEASEGDEEDQLSEDTPDDNDENMSMAEKVRQHVRMAMRK